LSATTLVSIKPATGLEFDQFGVHAGEQVNEFLGQTTAVQREWSSRTFEERTACLKDTAAVLREPAFDEEHAIALANDPTFGLGGAVFKTDYERRRDIATHRIRTGCCFVNTQVASDPRLPFGGIGDSGYGRGLSDLGVRTFVNAKTVAVK